MLVPIELRVLFSFAYMNMSRPDYLKPAGAEREENFNSEILVVYFLPFLAGRLDYTRY